MTKEALLEESVLGASHVSLEYELAILESTPMSAEMRESVREDIHILHDDLARWARTFPTVYRKRMHDLLEYCFRTTPEDGYRGCVEGHDLIGLPDAMGEYHGRAISYIHIWMNAENTIENVMVTLSHELVHHWLSVYEGQVANGWFDNIAEKVGL